ncbi:MAG: SPASM domain-containing protein [bacterium]
MIENYSSKIPDIFSRVEIEINTACNMKDLSGSYCSYCPNSIIDPIDPPQLMDDNLYTKIIDELKELGFSGRLSFHFYSEPLLHPQIEWIIKYATEKLHPRAERILYTNGDKLTESKYNKLVESGVTLIVISNHSKKEFPLRPFQTVLENFHINNKGGVLGCIKTLNLPCFVPRHRLVIAYNGDILLCYEDARRINRFGNIKDKSIKEVWFSDTFNKMRQNLIEGRRDLYDPCKVCDNQAHIKYGQINVNFFESPIE